MPTQPRSQNCDARAASSAKRHVPGRRRSPSSCSGGVGRLRGAASSAVLLCSESAVPACSLVRQATTMYSQLLSGTCRTFGRSATRTICSAERHVGITRSRGAKQAVGTTVTRDHTPERGSRQTAASSERRGTRCQSGAACTLYYAAQVLAGERCIFSQRRNAGACPRTDDQQRLVPAQCLPTVATPQQQ